MPNGDLCLVINLLRPYGRYDGFTLLKDIIDAINLIDPEPDILEFRIDQIDRSISEELKFDLFEFLAVHLDLIKAPYRSDSFRYVHIHGTDYSVILICRRMGIMELVN